MQVKEQLFALCATFVNTQLQTINAIITSNRKALLSETKSSAGDKHETGRAMLQLEMEKAGLQLANIQKMKLVLERFSAAGNHNKNAKNVHLGSIIYTDLHTYFLLISAGKLVVDNQEFYAISAASPLGKLLLGKQQNEVININGKQIKIKGIY